MHAVYYVGKRPRVAIVAASRKQPDAFNNLSGGNCFPAAKWSFDSPFSWTSFALGRWEWLEYLHSWYSWHSWYTFQAKFRFCSVWKHIYGLNKIKPTILLQSLFIDMDSIQVLQDIPHFHGEFDLYVFYQLCFWVPHRSHRWQKGHRSSSASRCPMMPLPPLFFPKGLWKSMLVFSLDVSFKYIYMYIFMYVYIYI